MSDDVSDGPDSAPSTPQQLTHARDLAGADGSSWLDSLLDAFGQDVISIAPPDSDDDVDDFVTGGLVADRYEVRRSIDVTPEGSLLLRAFDHVMQRDVSLKTVPNPADEQGGAESLLQELLLARAISHPNVCRVHDVAPAGAAGSVLVMQPCDTTLRKRLSASRQAPSEEEYRRIALQLASALAAIHKRGLVHGALNPSNVLLDGDQVMVLFGVAAQRGPNAPGNSAAPSDPRYHAPERLWDSFATRADDVYALGAMLWELLCGRAPEVGRTPRLDPLLQHAAAGLVLNIDADELRLLHRALSEDRTLRPAASEMRFRRGQERTVVGPMDRSVAPGPPPGLDRGGPFRPDGQALLVLYAAGAPNLVGRLVELNKPELTIGRHEQDIVLAESSVSRKHAVLSYQRGSWLLRDLKSSNGIYSAHSYERQSQIVLRHGDQVQLGGLRLKLVRFAPSSVEHWRARRFLTSRDGLTGLLWGAHFLAALQEEAAFAEWIGSPMRIVRFRLVIPERTTEPVALIAVERFCTFALSRYEELISSAALAGFVHRERLRGGGEATLLVAMVRVRSHEAMRLSVEVSDGASRVLPAGWHVQSDVTEVGRAGEVLARLGLRFASIADQFEG